jgi:hypothetical protein
VRKDSPDQPEWRFEHYPQDQREAVGIELGQRGDVLKAGVIDQYIDSRRQCVHRVEVGQVAYHRLGAWYLAGQGFEPCLVTVHGEHRRAVCHQPPGERGSDP